MYTHGKNIKCIYCANYKHEWCEKIVDSPSPDLIRDCKHFSQKTNFDHLTAMSIDEFAKFLIRSGAWSCYECKSNTSIFSRLMIECDCNCLNRCKDWLESYWLS